MVDLWSSAETGVGPSIAAGSQGWSPNWADFPAAAIKAPIKRSFILKVSFALIVLTSDRDQDLKEMSAKAKNNKRPISPIRL